MKTAAELASRIDTGAKEGKEGRYDLASKAEVRAYVIREVARIREGLDDEISALHRRVTELELSWWARIKRFVRSSIRREVA